MLTVEQSKELVARGFSRRNFGRLATMIAAGSTLPFANEQALAQLSMIKGGVPADAVKIDANENPMGPCPEALEAIHKAAANGGRYDVSVDVRHDGNAGRAGRREAELRESRTPVRARRCIKRYWRSARRRSLM